MGSPRQEYWSGLPFSSPGDLHGPGIELVSAVVFCDSSGRLTQKNQSLKSAYPTFFIHTIYSDATQLYQVFPAKKLYSSQGQT